MSDRASDTAAPTAYFRALTGEDPRTVAGYRLAAGLGAGGMGKVYLSHTPGGRPVAIKVIRPELAEDPGFRGRFAQEVSAAQRVHGPYTAPVIDAGATGPTPWLATAYVPGPTLAAAVARHGALPTHTVLTLVAGIAEALRSIHDAGVVHRDLKPSNVLLAPDGPRVIDFGIARAADTTSLTASGVAIGTPSFMSPEQAAGRRVGPATDVFALGQLAAYAALAAPAYGDGPSHGVLYRIVHEEPDLTGLPEELRPLVTRCLTKDPTERPTPAQLLDLCRAGTGTGAAAERPRAARDWLPDAVAAEITALHDAIPNPVPAPGEYVPTMTVTPAGGTPPAPPAPAPPMPSEPPTRTAPSSHRPAPPHPPVPVPRATVPGHHPLPGFGPPPHPAYATPPAPTRVPHPPRPVPYFVGPPPARSRGNRVLIVLGSIVGALMLLAGGCVAVGITATKENRRAAASAESAESGTFGGSGAGTDNTSPRPRTDPKPASYPGLELPFNHRIELGDDPLVPRRGLGDDMYLSCGRDCTFRSYDDATFVLLDSEEKGSLETCRGVTRFTNSIEKEILSKGAEICVRTDSGNLALVVYQGTSGPKEAASYVTLDVTVWRGALPPE
ncbi:serine/threonine-protein kinase (plasmid) [Streptomyces sp. BI20]|uniref:serine/threonine-protein kinase n=1 Tax=Streptomyces sp. BI20 TaxID=3403460 RepID=UPI003C7689AE